MSICTTAAPPRTPELWLFLREGLCNRLRVLLSALGYGDVTGRKLVARWPTSTGAKVPALLGLASHKAFRARFEDLFDPTRCDGLRLAGRLEWARMRRSSGAVASPFPPPRTHAARVLWLDRYDEFYAELPEAPHAYARRLAVRPELIERARLVRARFTDSRPRIGFHVRAVSAHEVTTATSPLSWFEREIRQALAECGELAPFFLSVDDASWARALHAKFPGALVESMPPPTYNSVAGIQKGLVDLTVLAACDHIVGSHYSSFSSMAFDLQGRRSYSDAKYPLRGSYAARLRERHGPSAPPLAEPGAHPWKP